jgi:hypothetical protein
MRSILILVLLAAFAAPVCAQPETSAPRWQIGFLAGELLPQAAFKSNLSARAWYVDFVTLRAVPHTPLWVGAAVGGGDYGSRKRRVSLASLIPESPSEFEVETTNWIVQGSLLLRLQPRSGRFRPYLEGVWGFSNFATQTTVTDPSKSGFCWWDLVDGSSRFSACPSDEVSSTTNLDDYAPSHGVGAGAQFEIRRWGDPGKGVRAASLSVDVRMRWLRGGEARYLKPGALDDVVDIRELRPLSSRTDVKTVQVGVGVHF